MTNVRFVSFVESKADIYAVLLALASINQFVKPTQAPMVLLDQKLLEEFESENPDIKIKAEIKKLGADLETAFSRGYNWNLGFRPAVAQLAKRIGAENPMLYFSPRVIFVNDHILGQCKDRVWAARQPDDFWPKRELYGPTLHEMWQSVVEFGGGYIEDWIDEEQPEEYWRRFPTASPHLFYAPNVELFSEAYSALNDAYIEDAPESLQGQGRAPKEAILLATIVAIHGEIIDPHWDADVIYYGDFYELILRLSDENAVRFKSELFEANGVRRVFKNVDEYKVIFYQAKLARVRERLDEIERRFSHNRMQTLIQKRKIRRNLVKRLKEERQAAKEATKETDGEDAA